jgi:hypothetical protein
MYDFIAGLLKGILFLLVSAVSLLLWVAGAIGSLLFWISGAIGGLLVYLFTAALPFTITIIVFFVLIAGFTKFLGGFQEFFSSVKRDWKKNLDIVVKELAGHKEEYDLDRIRQLVRPPNADALASELTERVVRGELKAFYRVLSRKTKKALLEFGKFKDIPEEIYDDKAGKSFRIEPSRDIQIVYRGNSRFSAMKS